MLFELFRDALLVGRPVSMKELALVAVRALLSVRTWLGHLERLNLLAQELIQRRSVPSQGIIGRHKPEIKMAKRTAEANAGNKCTYR